jgi:Radical SAM superfamily
VDSCRSRSPGQVLFAVALRSKLDGVRTVAGGAYVTEMAAGLSREPETFKYFDFLVVHEGESALLQIVNGQYFHPNVIGPGTDLANHPFCVEDIGALPDQDFSQFKLDLYRPWGLSLPLYSSKGCTWGRCAFCSVNFLCYRERDTTAFFESALRAARATCVHEIQLVDEDVTPERLRKLAELAISAGTGNSLRWFLQTRFYPALDRDLLKKLARGGFSTIEFGLESADRHTLKIARKGISLPIVRRIVADCEAAGIKVILNFMIGFPWESEESADKAAEFVDEVTKQHPGLDMSCNTQAVKVYVHSDMYRTPERYGTESAEPLPLSPTTRWTGPAWVPDFVRRHRQHLLFSRQSSAEPSIPEAGLLADLDPHAALAPSWHYLASVRSPAEVEEWEAGPLLVKASSEIGEVLRINPTLNAVLEELRDGCRISLLKERFLNHYPGLDRDQVSNALGDSLVMLNRMHALAFRAT